MNLDDCRALNGLLLDTFYIVEKAESTALREAGVSDLSLCEYPLIACVATGEEESQTIGDIAQALGVTLPTVTVMANKLVRKGYLEKLRSERDGRVVNCRLTPLATRISLFHRYFHRKMAVSVGQEFSDQELALLIRAIGRLNDFLQNTPEYLPGATLYERKERIFVFERVCERLATLKGIDAAKITEESRFSDLGIDSLDLVELMMDLEDEYGVILEPERTWETLGDLISLLQKRISEREEDSKHTGKGAVQ